MNSTLFWIRRDFRLHDNPALLAAAEKGAILPLFIWEEGEWAPGGASRWWFHHALMAFQKKVPVVIRKGAPLAVLRDVLKETGIKRVVWNRRYEPASIRVDREVKGVLSQEGMEVESFPGNLLFEPWEMQNKQGKPFQVFTPFWRACLEKKSTFIPLEASSKMQFIECSGLSIQDLELLPKIHWDQGIQAAWTPGEEEARHLLHIFLEEKEAEYDTARDIPSLEGTSRLSPYLHFGEITPRQIWRAAEKAKSKRYLTEIGWREFAHHLLFHFPHTPEKPLRQSFESMPWKKNQYALKAWQKGLTGYPIVDAGMRQLWQTGWMHNRVRMIVGSFLVKDLLLSWEEGARWFWDTLVDADLASNTLGWQWVGGCGADAAPFFRIFNPITQGEKFDPDGTYIRRYVPELKSLPAKWIHHPWDMPPLELRSCGVTIGKTYPYPLVDHAKAREEALVAFKGL